MIDYLRWSWVSDGSRVTRETDFGYRWSASEAFDQFLAARRP